MSSENILEVKNLHTYFYLEGSLLKAVEGLSFNLKKGEVLGLVGESGCGKSVAAYSLINLVSSPGKVKKGEVFFKGRDLLKLKEKDLSKIRGKEIAFVFQEPHAALDPVYNVGYQISETILAHNKKISKKQAKKMSLELLAKVKIKNPESKIKSYPHNLSGGEAQRVMIAQALSCLPKILIADEPTTALDVTVQAGIIELFKELRRQQDFSLIFITHDLALCSQIADRVAVMYAGQIVEIAPLNRIIKSPLHPYTKALFLASPDKSKAGEKLKTVGGEVPDPGNKPAGCFFHPRCALSKSGCQEGNPKLKEVEKGHWVRCVRLKG